ncbi:MAG: VWA domain-containing protein [Deltaproteobacteria bacterium]|nr:VWA domain-containing protein [Deltaproteobacteria bacterium]
MTGPSSLRRALPVMDSRPRLPRSPERARLLRALGSAALTIVTCLAALAYPLAVRGSEWLTISWEQRWVLLGLVGLPLVGWWTTFGQDRRRPRLRVGSLEGLVGAPRGIRARLRDLPGILRTVAIGMFLVALGRPVAVLGSQAAEDEGIDIVLAIDLSHSMAAILDGDPRDLPKGGKARATLLRPSRIDTAKLVVQDFIARRRSDRIGAIVFGKEAYILSPPTLDYQLLSKLIGQLRLDVIDGTRTAIGDAVGTAVARLDLSDARSKVVILLTDGDSNAGKYSPEEAMREAGRVGAKVYAVQIGNGEAAEVQVGTDPFGQPVYEKRVVPVNPKLLEEIATRTGGKHFIATDGKALRESMHAILDQLERTQFEAPVSHHEELFPLFVVPGVVLVALEALLRAWLLRRFP